MGCAACDCDYSPTWGDDCDCPDKDTDMASVTNLQIKIFKTVSDNPNAPDFRAILCDPDDGYAIVAESSLWYADDRATGDQKLDKNGNPFLTGKSKPPYKKS